MCDQLLVLCECWRGGIGLPACPRKTFPDSAGAGKDPPPANPTVTTGRRLHRRAADGKSRARHVYRSLAGEIFPAVSMMLPTESCFAPGPQDLPHHDLQRSTTGTARTAPATPAISPKKRIDRSPKGQGVRARSLRPRRVEGRFFTRRPRQPSG